MPQKDISCETFARDLKQKQTKNTHTLIHILYLLYAVFIHDYEFDGILFKQTHVDIKFNDFAALH